MINTPITIAGGEVQHRIPVPNKNSGLKPGDLVQVRSDFCHLWKTSAYSSEGEIRLYGSDGYGNRDQNENEALRRLKLDECAIIIAVKLVGRYPGDMLVVTADGIGWTDAPVRQVNE